MTWLDAAGTKFPSCWSCLWGSPRSEENRAVSHDDSEFKNMYFTEDIRKCIPFSVMSEI